MKRSRIRRKPKRNPLPDGRWEEVWRKQDGFCPCGAQMAQVHHVSNRGVGFKDHTIENLLGLCLPCHRMIHDQGKETYWRWVMEERA